MKHTILCLFGFSLCLNLIAQDADSTSSVSSGAEVYLIDANNPKKKIKIDPRGTCTFVQYDKSTAVSDQDTIFTEQAYSFTGSLDGLDNEVIYFSATEETHTIYVDYLLSSRNRGEYFETPKMMNLNLNQLDGMYYSSRRRDIGRNVMFSVLGVSIFTTFVVAPLASIEYKKTSALDASGFDRPMYFLIAGSGLLSAAISLPIIYLLRPKYYSFQGDNYSSSKRKWSLVAQ
jgi:hypothetical protein